MSAHSHTSDTTASESPDHGSPSIMWGILALIVVVLLFMGTCSGSKEDSSDQDTGGQSAATAPAAPTPPPPPVVKGVTPTTLRGIDYSWNIEADGPVRIKMPGVPTPVDFVPGKCTKFPEPRMGAYTFWSPTDSAGGRVNFRIYRTNRGEEC
jgi:hypothetical protein